MIEDVNKYKGKVLVEDIVSFSILSKSHNVLKIGAGTVKRTIHFNNLEGSYYIK
jgi:hypothetical protein